MITVNSHAKSLDKSLVEAYLKIPAANLGHFLDSAMDPEIQPLWRPVRLVGTALTVLTSPDSTAALAKAVEIAQPGDVLVVTRNGEVRHAFIGDFGMYRWVEKGIAGLVTDGPVTDRDAIEQLQFTVFCRGVSANLIKSTRRDVGAVNIPILVGGTLVSPGDLILADENGVIVASPEEAQERLSACQELGKWEEWAIGQMAKGSTFAEVQQFRQTYKSGRDG